jgi:histidinol-phosphate aminotransferase
VPVESSEPEALLEAVTPDTRVVVICNPNDPTGDYLDADSVGRVLAELPENVHVLLDEALVHFQDVERTDAALRLVDAFPRLLVFRTYSKIYGLSGLRAGYVVGPRGRGDLLEALAPALGVNTLTQAGIEQALKIGDGEVARRRELVIAQRRRLERELHGLPVQANPSQANFLWLTMSGMNGAQLAAHLESEGVLVAPGGPLGEDDHVRVTIRGAAATERLLDGLRTAA